MWGTVYLSDGTTPFVRNGVVQIPKFDRNPNPMLRFGQMTLRTSELSPFGNTAHFTYVCYL